MSSTVVSAGYSAENTDIIDYTSSAIKGINTLNNSDLMDYAYYYHGTYDCLSCRSIIKECYDFYRAFDHDNYTFFNTIMKKLNDPKYFGVFLNFDEYLDAYWDNVFFDIRGCKRCLNKALLDFGSDLELEETERDQDYTREHKNQRLHYAHHGSHKNSKASKKNKPISRNKKYRDVSVV